MDGAEPYAVERGGRGFSFGVEIGQQRHFAEEGGAGFEAGGEVDQAVEVFLAVFGVVEGFDEIFAVERFVEAVDDFAGIFAEIFLIVGQKDRLDFFPDGFGGGRQGMSLLKR